MIEKLKHYQQRVQSKIVAAKSLFTPDDGYRQLREMIAQGKEWDIVRENLRSLNPATVSYDPKLDRVIFTITSQSNSSAKFDIEIKRNSQEDRILRKMLLEQGLISEEESGAQYVRRVIPKFLSTADMPDPVYDDEYTFGQGEHGKEIVWESRVYPHLLIVGNKGTGKTNLTRNILSYAFHRISAHVYEIDLSIEDPKPLSLYRNMSRGCKTTIDDALEVVTMFHSSMKHRHKTGEWHSGDEILLIENAELVLPPRWIRPSDEPDIHLEKKQQIKQMLNDIIEWGDTVKNMHLVVTMSHRGVYEELLSIKDKEQVCYVSLGFIGPEDSQYLFNDDGGYFVSPYIKGRGYIRSGLGNGMEFQSYFIEDDYMNYVVYSHQLGRRR